MGAAPTPVKARAALAHSEDNVFFCRLRLSGLSVFCRNPDRKTGSWAAFR
jgi:hypothetical protein